MSYCRLLLFILTCSIFCSNGSAFPVEEDIYINGNYYNPIPSKTMNTYTILDANEYRQTIKSAKRTVKALLAGLKPHRRKNLDAQVAYLTDALTDIPYLFSGAMGEGDWQASATTYKPGAVHVKQDPVYRFDGLDCQTFVQTLMALLRADSLPSFEKNLVKIAYGAAGNPDGEFVRYFNRNHFVDGDWNPINQKNGFLEDVTLIEPLQSYSEQTTVNLTRQQWFLTQQKNKANVRVLNDSDGPSMLNRFLHDYANLKFPHFNLEKVNIAYIPKELLALKQPDGSYIPNTRLLELIPTPAVVEIVRDAKKWEVGGKNIKDLIGSELSISHMGILYRRTFHYGDLVYLKINCDFNSQGEKVCNITPVTCLKEKCTALMFANATSAYPNHFVFSKDPAGHYSCSAKAPSGKIAYSRCNRVEQKPLFNYFTDLRYKNPGYMNEPSIIGIHIERLL